MAFANTKPPPADNAFGVSGSGGGSGYPVRVYAVYADAWIRVATSAAAIEERWTAERNHRTNIGMNEDERAPLERLKAARIAELNAQPAGDARPGAKTDPGRDEAGPKVSADRPGAQQSTGRPQQSTGMTGKRDRADAKAKRPRSRIAPHAEIIKPRERIIWFGVCGKCQDLTHLEAHVLLTIGAHVGKDTGKGFPSLRANTIGG